MPEETNNNTNNKTKTKERYSPYDWEAFGFKIYDEDRDSHILSESPLIQPILQYVDENGDGKMSVEEFSRHKGNKNIRDLLSKMICVHRSEWAYSGDAFANLKKEVEKYYDEEIKRLNPDNENARTECESRRNEDLKLFEEKVKNLTFLDQIKLDNKSSLPDGYFYFFHPVTFVEQMNRVFALENVWHDPLDNPQIAVFSQSGYKAPANQVFGLTRNRAHQGVDLFALEGTPVYACLNGVVELVRLGAKGAGNYLIIKVEEHDQLEVLHSKKQIYSVKYPDVNGGEKEQGTGFNPKSKEIFFVYMHLSKILVKVNQKVKVGEIIGESGISGIVNGTCGPHLHFEIKSKNTFSDGLSNRVNPACYVKYKNVDELTSEELKIQEERKNRGRR